MPTSGEHKTVQSRILAYAEAIGWAIVSREEAELRRGIGNSKLEIGRGSLFFDDLLDANPSSPIGFAGAGVREFNPRYAEAAGALLGQFRHLHTDIYGNPPWPTGYGGTSREFLGHPGNRCKFLDHEEAGGWVFLFFVFRDNMAAYVSQKGVNVTNPAFLCRINRIRVIS